MSDERKELSPEAANLLSLIQKQRLNPAARMVPGVSAAFDAVGAYVQGAERRLASLERRLAGLGALRVNPLPDIEKAADAARGS